MAVQNINTYQGDPSLGQGTAGIGVGPIGVFDMTNVNAAADKLMQYQFLANRDQWARQNLLLDQSAQQAAADMKFTIGDWLEDDRKVIMGEIDKMHQMFTENPNRTRLKSDGSNANAIAEWQQQNNKIESYIQRANKRKQQQLGIKTQLEAATDSDTRGKIENWMGHSVTTPIQDDIILYFDPQVYQPTPAPTFEYTSNKYYDKDKKQFTKKVSAVDINKGVSELTARMENPKESPLRDYMKLHSTEFTKLISDTRAKFPGYSADQVKAELMKTEPGKNLFHLLGNAELAINVNNEAAAEKGPDGQPLAPVTDVAHIDWFNNGIDETAMKKITTAQNGQTKIVPQYTEVTTGLEQQRIGLQWAEFNQRKKEFEATKEKKIDPLIKYSVMDTLLSAPFQPGVTGDTVEIPSNTAVENMFYLPMTETTAAKGTATKDAAGNIIGTSTTTQKYDHYEIANVKAKKNGDDPNDTQIIVTYRNPADNTTFEKPYNRGQLNVAANNVLGSKFSEKIAGAAAEVERKLGTSNPMLEQVGFGKRQKQQAAAAGDTAANPIPEVPRKNGKWDQSKMVKGKWYKLPNGQIKQW